MKRFRVLLTGSQTWVRDQDVRDALDKIRADHPEMVLVHGDAQAGADMMGRAWAEARRVQQETYPARWRELGKQAGQVRNRLMVETMPDLVLAFCHRGSRGTTETVRYALEVGIPVSDLSQGVERVTARTEGA